MTKNYQLLKGQMGARFKSPGKSPKRINSLRRRSGGGGGASGVTAGGGGVAANIRVAVRVRPENDREKAGAFKNVIHVVDEQMLVFDPQETEESFYVHGRKQGMRDLNKKQNKDKKFTFDCVYGQESNNGEVFNGTTKDLIDTVFQGYNCSVFAYGATGAGKTFTMLGSQEMPGITCLTISEIYKKMETLSEDITCEIGISYLEVYNETVRDLLKPDGVLNVREDGKSGVTIPGLSIHKPSCVEDILRLLSFGNKNRSQHPTDANKESSRSHAVLQVLVQQKDKDAGLSAEVKVAKLSMIDLAGSEKGCVTGNKGVRFREGSNINKSLLALGNCINALAAGSKYIPYRDSKLTRLLKDSIGGNCRTVMIANVSPSSETFEDTFNTLKYADRAKKIKIDLKKNVLNVDFHVAQYAKIVEDLRGEIGLLKERIRILEVENEALKLRSVAGEGGVEPMHLDTDAIPHQIEQYKAQLADLLRRQQDYDSLQEKLAEFERQNQLQTVAATNHTAEIRELNERLRRQAEYIKLLESGIKPGATVAHSAAVDSCAAAAHFTAAASHGGSAAANLPVATNSVSTAAAAAGSCLLSDELALVLEKRRQLIKQFSNEKTLLATLTLRAHFKEQQHERADMISMTKVEKEKSVQKAAKAVEGLHRKMEKKAERCERVREELAANRLHIDRLMANNPDSGAAEGLVELEMRLAESQAESHHLHEMVHILGCEVEKLAEDMRVALPILTKNEKLLRGHSILSNEDKIRFDCLQSQILSNKQITWAENINNSISSELEAAGNVYKQCARLELPTLLKSKRPASVEQRVLFGDSTLQLAVGNDETCSQTQEETLLEATALGPGPVAQLAFPKLPPLPTSPAGAAFAPVAPPVIQVVETSFEMLPATPLVTRQNSGSLRLGSSSSSNNTNNTSFVLSPSPHSGGAENKENLPVPEVVTTPKRTADEFEETASAKKLRPDVSTGPVSSLWFAHRSANTMGTPNLDRSVDSELGGISPGPSSTGLTGGLNDTVILISNLDRQCDLGSGGTTAGGTDGLNCTYAVPDDLRMEGVEPMVVEDITSSCNILEMSNILPPPPPAKGRHHLVGPRYSPIKAGLGLSPTNLPTKRTPSPLRQSTLLDVKAGVGKSGTSMLPPNKPMRGRTPLKGPSSSTTPQPVTKTAVRRNLSSSQSTSVLPRPGPQPPVSFRSTIQRLNEADPAASEVFLPPDTREPGNYMQATASSKLKQGGTLERKKPNFQTGGAGGLQHSATHKLGVAAVSQKLGKFKRSVSATVLRPNK